jgi:hypothetical protein
MEEVKVLTSDGTYLEGIAEASFRYMVAKRFIDIVVSFLMIVLLAPLFLLIAAMVRMSSPGPFCTGNGAWDVLESTSQSKNSAPSTLRNTCTGF